MKKLQQKHQEVLDQHLVAAADVVLDILSGGSIAKEGATEVGQVFYGIDPSAMVYP